MQVANKALQPFLYDMGIDLRGRDIGVAEQGLHDAQIRAIMQQMAGESVTQHMRADQPGAKPGMRRQFFQVSREMLTRQVSALAERGKQPF